MEAEERGINTARQSATDDDRNRNLAALYREHSEGLRLLLLGILRNPAAADEALQQVFLKLLESWDTVQLATVKGWLYTVAYHEALAYRRRSRIDGRALDRLWSQPAWQTNATNTNPAGRLLRIQQRDAVRRAVEELPEAQRDVVQRRMYRDQTFAQIAAEIGCSLNTVLSRMRLAAEKLNRMLEDSQ